MRKRILGPHHAQPVDQSDKGWLDLEQIATVEVTSEISASRLNMRRVKRWTGLARFSGW